MSAQNDQKGFTLTEVLVSLVITSLVMAGVFAFFVSYKRISEIEDVSATVESTLRIASTRLSDKLRYAGYGVPKADLSAWIPWVNGFNSNPSVRLGADAEPDAVDIALCSGTVTTLSATASAGQAIISVVDDTMFDLNSKSLLFIGDSENARVTAVGAALSIDTDPVTAGDQGVVKTYYAGTPICRVDVTTFELDADKDKLLLGENQGRSPIVFLDDVSDLQITTLIAGEQYEIGITATSTEFYSGTGGSLSRTTKSIVTLRN